MRDAVRTIEVLSMLLVFIVAFDRSVHAQVATCVEGETCKTIACSSNSCRKVECLKAKPNHAFTLIPPTDSFLEISPSNSEIVNERVARCEIYWTGFKFQRSDFEPHYLVTKVCALLIDTRDRPQLKCNIKAKQVPISR